LNYRRIGQTVSLASLFFANRSVGCQQLPINQPNPVFPDFCCTRNP